MSKAQVTASITVDVEANTRDGLIVAAVNKIAGSSPQDWTFDISDNDEEEEGIGG